MESPKIVEWKFEDPPQFEPFWFEKINLHSTRIWVYENRLSASFYICFGYLFFIWALKQWMEYIPPYTLRKPLLVWNTFLATLSITAVIRGAPELFNVVLSPNGFHRSVCVRDGLNQPAAFWGFMFMFSKFLHFGDTVFLVLRKREITFLHCYHHFTVFWCTFYIFADAEPPNRWSAVMNYSVHGMMYSYYVLKSLHFRVPKAVKMFITGSEISMFAFGLYYNLYAVKALVNGQPCARTWDSIALQLTVGSSFLILFLLFFYKNYITRQKSRKD